MGKKWTGIGGSANQEASQPSNPHHPPPSGPSGLPPSNTHVQDFPDRIERLLQSISSVYMDNDNISSHFQKKRLDAQNVNKNMLREEREPSPGPGLQMRTRKPSVV